MRSCYAAIGGGGGEFLRLTGEAIDDARNAVTHVVGSDRAASKVFAVVILNDIIPFEEVVVVVIQDEGIHHAVGLQVVVGAGATVPLQDHGLVCGRGREVWGGRRRRSKKVGIHERLRQIVRLLQLGYGVEVASAPREDDAKNDLLGALRTDGEWARRHHEAAVG